MENGKLDFTIQSLGKATIPSPITLSSEDNDFISNYQSDEEGILYTIEMRRSESTLSVPATHLIERAGPRQKIFFDPAKTRAAIVTCGGLCPGLNNVIRSIVMGLWYRYGVKRINGIKFGYRGFLPEFKLPVLELTPDIVQNIHRRGGTILGSSRGQGDRIPEIVDSLERMNITILFVIGGDGSQRGAGAIAQEALNRGLKIAVVGIPKTIDNDLSFVQKSFGFETAVESAVAAVSGAHVEAHDAVNGVGIVKVMGRESGFIAAHTALAINDVNYVLIPEVPFDLHGEHGLLAHLEWRLEQRNHAVILVAEGAGQAIVQQSGDKDASGNVKLGDIGVLLKNEITAYFKSRKKELNLKYIDPSYIIRSQPANANDSLYCIRLGTSAVHAALAGKTGMIVSLIHDHLVHVPIAMATARRNRIDPDESLWRDVVEATGQPVLMRN
jgi:6-phosphofructokinase 1